MKVKNLIDILSKLDQELYVCSDATDESRGLFSGVDDVREADVWHDSLPAGAKYVNLNFDALIPHVRGEGAYAEKVPPDPPPMVEFKCPRCKAETTAPENSKPFCRCESWLPNMKPVPKEEAHAAATDAADREESESCDYDPDQDR